MNTNTKEIFDYYQNILQYGGLHVYDNEDKLNPFFLGDIFIEFSDICIWFNEDNLKKLFNEGYISREKMNKSFELYNKSKDIFRIFTGNVNEEDFNNNNDWRYIMLLCDEIKKMK